jgi:cytosine/adenosine deaminase-related metal-dependent hydrolase
MLVGDTQRIWVYAKEGFAEPQPIDQRTLHAYQRLLEAGYTRRLIAHAPAPTAISKLT